MNLYLSDNIKFLKVSMRAGEINLELNPKTTEPPMTAQHDQAQDVQTLPAVQEQEMRAMQNLFQRAANTIVEASNLGKEVQALKEQLKGLLADTDRMRDHITWLEQENATLRQGRDDAQNELSTANQTIDRMNTERKEVDAKLTLSEMQRETARGDAKLWQEEATSLEKERNGLKAEVTYLKGMLTSVWHGIKDHFTEPQAPKAEPEPTTEPTQVQAQVPYHESPVAGATFNPHKPEPDIQF